MKTKLFCAILLCGLAAACSNDEPETNPAQEEAFQMIEAFGELQHKGDYAKCWDYLSAGRQEMFRLLLEQPVTGARDTVATMRPILEPDSKAEPSEKERVKGVLEKYPPWETLKSMTAKEYYVWRMNKDVKSEARQQSKAFYHRDNIKEMVLEGAKGYIDWIAKGADRQYLILEDGKWKFGLNPKLQREFEASKSNQEKR